MNDIIPYNTGTEECLGCSISYQCILKPVFFISTHEYRCPCIVCLVKCTCRETCDNFLSFCSFHKEIFKKRWVDL